MGTLSLSDYEDVRIWAPWGHIAGRWYGNRSERPILAIHGWLDNLGSFDNLIPLLPDYLGVLCIDLPGQGLSPKMPPGMNNSTISWTLIIARIIKEYNWPKVSLMGHSLGGSLCYIFASIAPHMVDMVISLEIIVPYIEAPQGLMFLEAFTEKHLVEELRAEEAPENEPPSFTLDHIRSVVSKGSNNSVPPEFAQHLIYRSVAKSQLYPDKYFFTRDRRVRYYRHQAFDSTLAAELTRRIKDIPYLIIKAEDSTYINSECDEILSIFKEQNPHFEYHEVPGGHHVHLVDAKQCAQFIVPFLRRYRPPPVSSWGLAAGEQKLAKSKRTKALQGSLARSQRQVGKL